MEFNCRIHPGQVYLFYCINHDVPCCPECKRISHTVTCEFEVMDPRDNEKDFGLKMADTLKRMTKTNTLLDELYKEFYESRKHLWNQKEEFENDLRHFRQQIDAHVDDVENKIRDKFTDLYNKEVETVKQREAGVLMKIEAVDKWIKGVEAMAKHETNLQSYVYLSKIGNSFSVIEKHASKIEKQIEYVTLSFKVSNDYVGFVKGLKLAHTYISRSATVKKPEPKSAFPTAQCKLNQQKDFILRKISEFSIVKESDFHSPSDMMLLLDDNIVVTNLNNRRLVVYDQNGISQIEMELSHNPLHITKMADGMIGMTLAHETKIIILNAGKRTVHKQIRVEDECHGIAYTNEKLIVNGKMKGLFILNSRFQIENTMSDITGKLLLSGTSQGTVVCGALLSNEVFCIDMHGTKLFEIVPSGLEYLNGIFVSDSGETYVTGFLSNTIHKIDANGESSCVLLTKDDGINLPRAVCYENSTSSVMVVNNDGQCVSTYRFASI